MNNKLKLFFKPLCASLALFLVTITPAFAHPTVKKISGNSKNAAGTYTVHEGCKIMRFYVTSSSRGDCIVEVSGKTTPIAKHIPESTVQSAMISYFQSH